MKKQQVYSDINGVQVLYQRRRPDEYEIVSENGLDVSSSSRDGELVIEFQAGPVKAEGVNGVQVEQLLAVCRHRLDYLYKRLPDGHTEEALRHVERALHVLEERTAARVAANVEGTDKMLMTNTGFSPTNPV